MKHPTPVQLASYVDGESDAATAEAIRAHLDACPECRDRLEQMRALHQAIWDTRPTWPEMSQPAVFMAGLRQRIPGSRLSWSAILLVGPALFVMASLAAKLLIISVVGDNLLQRAGLVSSGPDRLTRWSSQIATSDLLQRTVGDPLGWTSEQTTAAAADIASHLQNMSVRPVLPGLILIAPMALMSGVAVLALGWFLCWVIREEE